MVERNYTKNIIDLLERQRQKGIAKYGQIIEDNTTLTSFQRIEHFEEELMDALMYAQHLKVVMCGSLTANDFQRAAMRTAAEIDFSKNGVNGFLLEGVLGLNGEAGECIDVVKKTLCQGHELDREHLIEELGDVAWYLAVCCEGLGVSLEEVMEKNIEKLRARYPEGFDKARSINRSEKTYALAEVVEEPGIELGTEKPKKRKTFLEDYLEKNPGKTVKEVMTKICVEHNYPIKLDCTGAECHYCWDQVMPKYISEGGEDKEKAAVSEKVHRKTYLEDFLEKFPDAPMECEDNPEACCGTIYGASCIHECEKCWVRFMPEEE